MTSRSERGTSFGVALVPVIFLVLSVARRREFFAPHAGGTTMAA